MPRRVQDIVSSDKRSIRNVPIDKPARMPAKKGTLPVVTDEVLDTRKESKTSSSKEERVTEVRIHKEENIPIAQSASVRRMPMTPPPARKSRRGKMWLVLTLLVIILIAGAGYVASAYFSRATFTIIPKTIPVSVNATYVIPASAAAGTLAYDVISVHGAASTTVAASDGPQTSAKAQGKVTLYNESSTQSQRLIAGTRLADASNRIYRLVSSVVIPGYTKNASGAIVPGSLSTTVTADQPGQQYNISRTGDVSDFKVVAYQGTSKYDTIYARIAGDITGGFVGAKKTVSPTLLASTTATLKSNLTSSLLEQVKKSVPAGYVMYPSAYVPVFSAATVGGTDKNSAIVSEQGTVYGIVFKQTDLIARLAGADTVAGFGKFSYTATGLDALDFSIANAKDFAPDKKTSLIAHMKGNMIVVGAVPVDEIKTKLAGMSLSDTQKVFDSYSKVIESGSGELAPPWSKIPSDTSRITVNIEEK